VSEYLVGVVVGILVALVVLWVIWGRR